MKNFVILLIALFPFSINLTLAQATYSKTYSINDLPSQGVGIEILEDSTMVILTIEIGKNNLPGIGLLSLDLDGIVLWKKYYSVFPLEFKPAFRGSGLIHCQEGGFAITGSILTESNELDYFLMRVSEKGDSLWTKTYGGVGRDLSNKILQTNDGGFLLVGLTESTPTTDIWLVKTDAEGEVEWEKSYTKAGNNQAWHAHLDKDGGFLISGWTSLEFGTADALAIKTDSLGNILWEKTRGTSGSDSTKDFFLHPQGGYWWMVRLDSTQENYPLKLTTTIIYHLTESGEILSEKEIIYGSNRFVLSPYIVTSKHLYFVGDEAGHPVLEAMDIFRTASVMKWDQLGNELWRKQFRHDELDPEFAIDHFDHAALAPDGTLVCVGWAYDYIEEEDLYFTKIWVVKMDENGCVEAAIQDCEEEFQPLDIHTPSQANTFQITPNPNNGAFTIRLLKNGFKNGHIRILNLTGQVLLEQSFTGEQDRYDFNMNTLKDGIYLIQIFDAMNQAYISEKLVITK